MLTKIQVTKIYSDNLRVTMTKAIVLEMSKYFPFSTVLHLVLYPFTVNGWQHRPWVLRISSRFIDAYRRRPYEYEYFESIYKNTRMAKFYILNTFISSTWDCSWVISQNFIITTCSNFMYIIHIVFTRIQFLCFLISSFKLFAMNLVVGKCIFNSLFPH